MSNGNTEQGDGYKYRGRGYVQVTWKNSYRAVGKRVDVDLVNNPDRMQEPAIAAWQPYTVWKRGFSPVGSCLTT
ncbi:glycoside hydrolase family 19 protein [Paraburkholderia sp. A2RI-6]|uniref:glycoside hydrolase family 19 protein n=1 Tax=Paraburkholderia sp. A2RI-6 TaxID=3028371 RepID=UPI003BA2B109